MFDGAISERSSTPRTPQNTIELSRWGIATRTGSGSRPGSRLMAGCSSARTRGRGGARRRTTRRSLQSRPAESDGSPDITVAGPVRLLASTSACSSGGGPGDDLCQSRILRSPPAFRSSRRHPAGDGPVQPILARPPQPITGPLALDRRVAAVGHDFAPDSFVSVCRPPREPRWVSRGRFRVLEGERRTRAGHDIELVNFNARTRLFPRAVEVRVQLQAVGSVPHPDGPPRCKGGTIRRRRDARASGHQPAEHGDVRARRRALPRRLRRVRDSARAILARDSLARLMLLVQIRQTGVIWRDQPGYVEERQRR